MDPAASSPASSGGAAPANPLGPESDLTGEVLGDFRILRRLGQGGMGQVYLAEQISLKRKVALKLLRGDLASNAVSLQRFKAEAVAVARATHANIVQVYAIDEARSLHFMALEYVEGRNLREFVEKKGPPEVLVALSIMRQVASALQRASELGIIHRDIKPENILLTRKGEAKVADFGLSRCFADDRQALRLTQSGVAMGTPLYMSPEQVEGKPVDPRADIYSFGVTCYFMLAGQPPFQGQTAFAVALQHVQTAPRPLGEIRPDLPPELPAMVHRMMAKLPEERYQTGREIVKEVARLRDTLVGVKSGEVSRLVPTTSLPAQLAGLPTGKRPGHGPWLRWLGPGIVLLALAAGSLVGWLRSSSLATATEPATKTVEAVIQKPVVPGTRDRERMLRTEWARYTNPGNDREQVTWGLKYAVELGLLYLDDQRLDEAADWFKDVEKGNHLAYRMAGRMGQAIVLAFQDRWAQSNRLLQSIAPAGSRRDANRPVEAERWWFRHLVTFNKRFAYTLARALDHNFDNSPPSFPRALESLRHPPNAPPNPGGKAR
jgi:serine/threonine-protein kinase